MDSFDWIIVGGGVAGCVLAARLSERSDVRVLLVEAGDDIRPHHEPADIRSVYPGSYYNKAYMWPGLAAHWRMAGTSPATGFDQARIMGGGGSVMGMVALRGTPSDYDEWDALGARGWNWNAVLPFFRKLETDRDFRDPVMHGGDGPTAIRRVPAEMWPPLSRAVRVREDRLGGTFIDDMNGDFREGLGALPMSNTPERRSSSVLDYLAPARARPNLTVLSNTLATRLILEGRQVVGVNVRTASGERVHRAREIVLSAGAIFTPALLMRSGIGPGDALSKLGIPVVADLPAVGGNLQNHAILFIGGHLKRRARQAASLPSQTISCFRFSSELAGAEPADLYINIQSKSSWTRLGGQIANLGVVLLKPESRGRVSLRSSDPADLPLVEFNMAGTELDVARLKLGFRRLAALALDEEIRPLFNSVFAVSFNDRIRRLNRRSRANAAKAAAIATALDVFPPIARFAFSRLTDTKADLATLVADDAMLTGHVIRHVGGTFHVAGTCRMGEAGDRAAVTDASGRVHGVGGLRVVDASLMPTVPRGNTNIPTIMIAEKIAAELTGN